MPTRRLAGARRDLNTLWRAEIDEEVPVATTRSRPRGRETARPNGGGVASDHISKIMASVIAGAIAIVAGLTFTSIGHTIDLAVQHFMLFYAGVLTLIALCASVGAGLVSTDRMFLHPGQRVMMQSIHRAASFGAFTFLIVHVVTEILAQRIDVIDVFIPFLQPFKTFYVGLGTIAGDIIILLVITGILRKRFATNGKGTWRWRAIHYTNYVAFVFGVWHGLLGGRPGKPYVDWSYGFVVAFVALGVAIRVLSNSLRPKEALSAPAVADSAPSGTAPLRAAILAQSSSVRRPAAPAAAALENSAYMLPAAAPEPYQSARVMEALPAGSDYAPDYVDVMPVGSGYDTTAPAGSPVYEPGYDGPPRYQGAPRPATGPMQAVPNSTISGPLPQVHDDHGYYSGPRSGPMPAMNSPVTGQMSRAMGPPSGGYRRPPAPPRPQLPPAGPPSGGHRRPATGPMPRVPGAPTGGFAGPPSGPMPSAGPPSGGFRRPSGPMPQAPGGPSGPYPRPPAPPMPPAGYGETPYGDGYEEAPQRGAPQDPRQAYRDPRNAHRGGGGRR